MRGTESNEKEDERHTNRRAEQSLIEVDKSPAVSGPTCMALLEATSLKGAAQERGGERAPFRIRRLPSSICMRRPALIESGIRDRKVHKEGKNIAYGALSASPFFWASSMAEVMW